MTGPEILDPTCSGKSIWMPEQRDRDDVLWIDRREADTDSWRYVRKDWEVKPDEIGDFRDLDSPDNSFNLVVFDPPHITNNKGMEKLSGLMEEKYGALHAETWQRDIRHGFEELWRVLRPGGTLVMKWADTCIAFQDVLEQVPQDPLFGTRTTKNKSSQNRWFVFYKPESEVRQQ